MESKPFLSENNWKWDSSTQCHTSINMRKCSVTTNIQCTM